MKKRVWFMLVAVLLLSLLFSAKAERITEFERLLQEGSEKDIWQLLVPDYSSGYLVTDGRRANLKVWSPESPVMPVLPEDADDPLLQSRYTVKIQETNGISFSIDQIDQYNVELDPYEFVKAPPPPFAFPVTIPAYGSYSFECGGPALNSRYEIIVVTGVDENGHELEFYGVVERLFTYTDAGTGIRPDPDHDTDNLRYGADYEVEVAQDVWWVPVVSLGDSRYTNTEIAGMVAAEPEEKQAALGTLYEALQMFQISGFHEGDDNVRITENDIDWEHHKPGYDAVRTNTGCCATDSNWLNYILRDDYDEVGFLAYSQSDGGGHILNYIRQDGYYYFIDLTHYRTDFLDSSAPETGNMNDYNRSDMGSGNLHKCTSPESYVAYCTKIYNDPPELFFIYRADDCLPVTGKKIKGQMTILYPKTAEVTPIRGNTSEPLEYKFVNPPKKHYNWSVIPGADFTADMSLVSHDKAGKSTSGLTAWQAGDLLPLKDFGEENGYAEIDGRTYLVCDETGADFSVRKNLPLSSRNYYSYYNDALNERSIRVAGLTDRIRATDSLLVANGVVSFSADIRTHEIVVCVERVGSLEVLEVIRDKNYYCQSFVMESGGTGWHRPTDTYWFLMIYEQNGEMEYRFGRYRCGRE